MWVKSTAIAMLLYPLISHVSIVVDKSQWAGIYLLAVFLLLLLQSVRARAFRLTAVWLVLSAVGVWLIRQGDAVTLMLIPPVAINCGLLLLFGQSLKAGETPLITRYAQILDGELSQELKNYTRYVTRIWVLFFFLMLIESVALAMYASVETWSLFTNVINYLLIAVLFLSEYVYRKIRFNQQTNNNFFQFVWGVLKLRARHSGH